jgi:addiction module HigA family antidote
VLVEAISAIGEPKTKIADLLGISRQHLNDIIAARKPITANVAVRVGKLVGNDPVFWLKMQAAHDAWHAARNIDLTRIPTLVVRHRNEAA